MNDPDLYCSLFVNCTLSDDELHAYLRHELNGRGRVSHLETRYLDACVVRNKDYDPIMLMDPLDGFLFYPCKIEIDPVDPKNATQYKAAIAAAMRLLREAGMEVVASCSFEEELG